MKKALFISAIISAVLFSLLILTFSSSAALLPFDDVQSGKWYTESVYFCDLNGYMNGTSDTVFSGDGYVTRAQCAVILAKASGDKALPMTESVFADVECGKWYSDSIKWMCDRDMTSGIGGGAFGVSNKITREQLCVFMMKFARYCKVENTKNGDVSKFTDIKSASPWALESIKYCTGLGIISGTGNTTFSPKSYVTRYQMSVIIHRFMENIVYGDHTHTYCEASCTAPSYCTVCGLKREYALGHDTGADCRNGGYCNRCRQTIAPRDHMLQSINVPASCEAEGYEAYRCRFCTFFYKVKIYPKLGHTVKNGLCSRCQKLVFQNAYQRLIYFMARDGYTEEEHYTDFDGAFRKITISHNNETDYVRAEFEITPKNKTEYEKITLGMLIPDRTRHGGHFDYGGVFIMDLPEDVFECYTVLKLRNGEVKMDYNLNSRNYSPGNTDYLSDFLCDTNRYSDLMYAVTKAEINDFIDEVNSILNLTAGVSLSDFGFYKN